jgi:hypothetical protein
MFDDDFIAITHGAEVLSSATLTSAFTMSNYGHIWSCPANFPAAGTVSLHFAV